MNRIEEQLQNLHHIRLSDEVRARMRADVLTYADLHAIQAPNPVRSTFHIFSMRLYAGLAAMVLVVTSIGGTTYAAEGALPGDTLYSFKLHVSEPVQTALIPSEEGKGAWHAILAERRLEEAAKLAAEDNLSAEAQELLAANFSTHVETSAETASRLEEKGDIESSLSLRSDLEARLTAHQHILGVIAAHYAANQATSSSPTHIALTRLITSVQERESDVVTARLALEDQIAPHTRMSAKTSDSATAMTLAVATEPLSADTAVSVEEGATSNAMARIDKVTEARTKEIDHIIERNALLLAKFLPVEATTTASTTIATSTAELDADLGASSTPSTPH
jgi:hypothetical protein